MLCVADSTSAANDAITTFLTAEGCAAGWSGTDYDLNARGARSAFTSVSTERT
jgi:hypothetical protein